MEYKEFYRLNIDFEQTLIDYIVVFKTEAAHYHLAKRFLEEMHLRAQTDKVYRKLVSKWFNGGGTIALKNSLHLTSYDHEDLAHFNAFLLMDSTSLLHKSEKH